MGGRRQSDGRRVWGPLFPAAHARARRTRIGECGRNRLERYGQAQTLDPKSPAAALVAEIARQIEAGLDPAKVAVRVLDAIREDELYIFTHPNMRESVDGRFAAIQAAMDRVPRIDEKSRN